MIKQLQNIESSFVDFRRTYWIICSILLWCCTSLQGQQQPQYSLNMIYPSAYNPAYAATSSKIEAIGVFRKQWQGLVGSPSSQYLNALAPIPYLKGAVGIKIENDKVGALQTTQVALGYAYKWELEKEYILGIGCRGGMLFSSLDGAKLLAPGGEYEGGTFLHNDNLLPESKIKSKSYQLDAGIFLKTPNFGFGASALHLSEGDMSFYSSDVTNYKLRRQYMTLLTYTFAASNEVTLIPSVWGKTNTIQHQLDVSLRAVYVEKFTLGVLYRGYNTNTSDALGIFGGWKLTEHWKLFYNFDIPLSTLKEVNQGSHEIVLKYELDKTLGKGKMPKVIHTPRLL